MIEFITNPIVEVVDDDTFILRDDFVVKYFEQVFVVPSGFMTDFASVPRIPVAYMLFAGKAKKAAVLHDWLYTTKPCTREEADRAFLCAMEELGIGWFVRQAMYRGVRFGGQTYWDKA